MVGSFKASEFDSHNRMILICIMLISELCILERLSIGGGRNDIDIAVELSFVPVSRPNSLGREV